MDMQAGLRAFTTFSPVGPTFPNASHVCEVEIDPDTGQVVIDRYAVVCDVGTVINPLLLEGQVHGGVVQGLGQILLEEMVWDPDTGQPVTGSFMDYAMPRADNIPSIDVATNDVPTSKNPIGAKGAGESGTVGAMPCLYNAIADALAIEGATMVSMPASPEKIWRAIAAAR
jgi:carbon-monoxide dehydrogenase large subunit